MIKIVLTTFLLLMSVPSQAARSPGTIGNGGDPREMMFRRAKLAAVNLVYKLTLYPDYVVEIYASDDPRTKFSRNPFLLERLTNDIFSSPHMYDKNPRPTCAWTNDPDASVVPHGLNTIRISLPTCGPFLKSLGDSFAIHTLIHESVHHLLRNPKLHSEIGLKFIGSESEKYEQEESFADDIAELLSKSHELVVEAGKPHWKNISVEHKLAERGFHTAVWTGESQSSRADEKMIIWGGCSETENAIYGCGQYFNDGSLYDPEMNVWEPMATKDAPAPRIEHATAWTGQQGPVSSRDQFIVWGGCSGGDGCINYLNSGAIYDADTDQWTPIKVDQNTPSARSNHSMVWTGSEFIVWGGSRGVHSLGTKPEALADGAAYDINSKRWRKTMPAPNEFAARSFHTAIWTGDTGNPLTSHRMLVWGGCDYEEFESCRSHFNDLAAYDPVDDEWKVLATAGAVPSPRRLHGAVHIAEHNALVVWGGQKRNRRLKDGSYLNLMTLKWERMNNSAPEKRSRHTMVWTGDHLIIFGGADSNSSFASDIGTFEFPVSGTGSGRWRDVEREFHPLEVKNHTAVWSPYGMIIWGGQSDHTAFENFGSAFVLGDML